MIADSLKATSRNSSRRNAKRAKYLLVGSASTAAMIVGFLSAARAQSASDVEQVTVSSTRITAAGFEAPTPTTIIGADYIAKNAEANVFTTITQLPSLQGSTGVATQTNGTSGGTNGLSSFGLRGLGTIRTLTLIDGERVVPANVTGVADVSEFPQLLIQRVDVVTGGASASYGSDAVAGVVNFITDKKFEGFKANVQGGVTTYGDDINTTAQGAYGTSFAGGRGHFEVSGEYSYESGIPPNGFGAGPGPNGRNWFVAPAILQQTIANTPAGSPQYTYVKQSQDYQFAKYGLITAGPLQGTAFGANGTPTNFVYGSSGIPAKNAAGTVSNCISPFCVGGDQSGDVGNGTSLASSLTRGDVYSRISYDITPNVNLFATLNVSEVASASQPNPGAFKNANLTVQCGNAAGGANAYLPAAINAACVANNITNFQYGTANAEFPNNIQVKPLRNQRRYVLGSEGSFGLFGKDWTYDTYFQHGENDTSIHVHNISLTPRYNAAIDAVTNPSGTIVCRSAVAQASGCVPLNIIGNVAADPAAINYIEPQNGPIQQSYERQEAFSASINGQPFTLWAGPVSVATGYEYREEAYHVQGDPYGNGVSATDPNTVAYPADPLLNATLGNNWYAGNFHNGGGNYHVNEAFVETGVPLLNDSDWGKIDLDLAGRYAHYSTSGDVETWKVGGTWVTPIDGIKLRGVQSRDVRAPNLSELFAAPIVSNGTVINRLGVGAPSVTILNQAVGNPGLKTERSQTSEVGMVFQPSWLPGFSASIDYFRVAIKGEIASLNAQQIVDACQLQGNAGQCANVLLTSPVANTNFVRVQSFNLATVVTDGFDLEAGYQMDLGDYGLPGSMALRGLLTHTSKFLTDPGIPGAFVIQSAGDNTGNTPLWKGLFTQDWENDSFGFTLTERWFSDGVYRKEYIQCVSGCPIPTAMNPTIDNNKMDGAFYLDVGGSWKFSDVAQLFFKIDNIANSQPAPSPTGAGVTPAPNSFGANPVLYDTIGRMYRLGVRFNAD